MAVSRLLILILHLSLPELMRFQTLYWKNFSIADNRHLILQIPILAFLLVCGLDVRTLASTHTCIPDATPEEARLYGSDGPLWYRGWALEDEKTVCESVDQVLAQTGTRRMIMGHTPDFHASS